MTLNGYLQIGFYFVVLIALVKPLGSYMARVYEGKSFGLDRVLGSFECLIYRLCGVRSDEEMNWKTYALAMLLFNFAGLAVLYVLQRWQHWLPLNPQGFAAVTPDSSFNTAVSFTSNTNWQGYGGETTMSYLTQMLGLTVQNFVSAAAGMATLIAFIRGLARRTAETIGNFWVDLVRTTLYILLPLAVVLALIQVPQGVIQNFSAYQSVPLLQPTVDGNGNAVTEQLLPMGPAASQIAIKQLGTNGGGFFNVNSAHPFENATPFSNFFDVGDSAGFRRIMLHLRQNGRRHAPRLGGARGDDRHLRRAARTVRGRGAERQSRFHEDGCRSNCRRTASRRQHGRQGSALRHRQLGVVGNGDDCCLKRLSQLDARLLYAARWFGADVVDAAR
jgi:hypothetical protein